MYQKRYLLPVAAGIMLYCSPLEAKVERERSHVTSSIPAYTLLLAYISTAAMLSNAPEK